jgi:hypothetical protein
MSKRFENKFEIRLNSQPILKIQGKPEEQITLPYYTTLPLSGEV